MGRIEIEIFMSEKKGVSQLKVPCSVYAGYFKVEYMKCNQFLHSVFSVWFFALCSAYRIC